MSLPPPTHTVHAFDPVLAVFFLFIHKLTKNKCVDIPQQAGNASLMQSRREPM